MRFLPDAALYAHTDDCLAYLRARPETPTDRGGDAEPVPVHFFWQGAFAAKPALCLKSFFATQEAGRFTCWLWLPTKQDVANAAHNPHLAPLLPFIRLHHFDLATEIVDTPLAGQAWMQGPHTPVQLSDLARLLVLYHHGGIYSDLDALFLRDLGPLLQLTGEAEFCFQWSYVRRGTNAFCRQHRRSPAGHALLQAVNLHRSAHASALFDFDRDSVDMLVLPVAFFSPLWLHVDHKDRCAAAPFDRFADFFRRFRWWFRPGTRLDSHRDFFPGAFTYHWHGLWRAPEHRDSCAGIVAASLEAELRQKYPALAALPPYGGAT